MAGDQTLKNPPMMFPDSYDPIWILLWAVVGLQFLVATAIIGGIAYGIWKLVLWGWNALF